MLPNALTKINITFENCPSQPTFLIMANMVCATL